MMRDLDQIRERDDARDSQKLVLIGLGGLAAACVLFAAGVLIGREGEGARAPRREDPLARLDALAGQVADAGAPAVTYPERLLDSPAANALEGPASAANTTAASVAGAHAALTDSAPEALRAAATVPASALVETTGRVRDTLPAPAQLPVAPANQYIRITPSAASATASAAAANPLAAPPVSATPAPAGSDGAFTLQVSSFRTAGSAQLFAQRLRERGHRAYVAAPATAPNGAVWHRVRVGPFNSLREASRYRADFEARERLPTFVVRRDDPNRTRGE